jgi:hypothetical protein
MENEYAFLEGWSKASYEWYLKHIWTKIAEKFNAERAEAAMKFGAKREEKYFYPFNKCPPKRGCSPSKKWMVFYIKVWDDCVTLGGELGLTLYYEDFTLGCKKLIKKDESGNYHLSLESLKSDEFHGVIKNIFCASDDLKELEEVIYT